MIRYESQTQLSIEEFKTAFELKLSRENRWVKLAESMPWDTIAKYYNETLSKRHGRPSIDARIVIGSLIIKHKGCLSDEETIESIRENVYQQYFLGLREYRYKEVFDASLFVTIRKRMGSKQFDAMVEEIMQMINAPKGVSQQLAGRDDEGDRSSWSSTEKDEASSGETSTLSGKTTSTTEEVTNRGMLIVDMTVAPADITYPTDMELLNMSREKTEEMIDVLYGQVKEALQEKPRTHRRNARKAYLIFAKKRKRSYKFIRKSIRKQLGYVGRNIRTIHQLLDRTPGGLDYRQMRTFWIIQELYRQQKEMYNSKTNRIDDRIVSVNQPQVRPIVRQKKSAPVEFGAQVSTSIMNGLKRIESIKWDACNEADDLPGQIEHYKETYGYYPDIVLADKKYGTKKNRVLMKELGIRYGGTPLGRPKKDQSEFLPKEVVNQRNAIEGNYGTGKRSYGLDCIKARRADTSESWIGAIFFVMNLPLIVKLLGSSILSCSKSGFSRLLELFFIPRWSVITEP